MNCHKTISTVTTSTQKLSNILLSKHLNIVQTRLCPTTYCQTGLLTVQSNQSNLLGFSYFYPGPLVKPLVPQSSLCNYWHCFFDSSTDQTSLQHIFYLHHGESVFLINIYRFIILSLPIYPWIPMAWMPAPRYCHRYLCDMRMIQSQVCWWLQIFQLQSLVRSNFT